jgi:Alginate lyase/F5/8 type C domain
VRRIMVMVVGAAAALLTGVSPAAAATTLPVVAVTASASDANVAGNAVDGNAATRWSGEGDGVWIRFDLGAVTTVGSVSLSWYQGDSRTFTFDVQLSQDGTSWSTVLSRKVSSGSSAGPQAYDVTDGPARYVRVVGHGNTKNDWTSISEATVLGAGTGGGGTCRYPADVLDLHNWYIGLPTGAAESPTNVKQPALATFSVDPWFVATPSCTGVQFRAAVNGVTTSGSSYPRSELREMSGSSMASWSSTSGTHTMTIRQQVQTLPSTKPHVVVGQIHDAADDVSVFRVEGSNLYLTNGDDAHFKLITGSFALNTSFEVKFVVSGGQIKAYYNGTLVSTISKSFSGAYFKAGAYTQANCTNSSPCSSSNYAQVVIDGLTVSHS